ncbi:hypothetical protein QZM18_10270 [Burkholderia diffusa]|uniref:hypothetical protein n=1 Tax=Burkholderia diffusa TaxID=488732 RepID=UPI00265394D3|nr:hypothetical protein [Burkholderia diffusa]MDN7904503.1 hypothetical protein [Burkholderia diffusa]
MNATEKQLEGKSVFVLGSAPGVSLSSRHENDVVIAINGSGIPFPSIVPDILFINAYTTVARTEVARKTMARIGGLKVRHIIGIETGQGLDEMLQALAAAGLQWDSASAMTREERRDVTGRAIGRAPDGDRGDAVLSTGVTALGWAVEQGAVTIRWDGFSLLGGHSYLPDSTNRDHVRVDSEAFVRLFGVHDPSGPNQWSR